MTTRILLSLTILTLGISNCWSEPIVFTFSSNNAPFFDFSGRYQTNLDGIAEDYTIALSPRGRMTAPFTVTQDDATTHLMMNGTLNGSIVSSKNDFQVAYSGGGQFTGTVHGIHVTGTATIRGKLTPDSQRQILAGNQVITACIPGRPCRTLSQPMEIPLTGESANAGDWTLTLDLSAAQNKVTGTALVTLSNGRMVNFNLRGTYSAAKSVSNLRLIGTGDAAGVTLQVQLGADNSLRRLNGRLFGQRLSYSAP